MNDVVLKEWESQGPGDDKSGHQLLSGAFLSDEGRRLTAQLHKERVVEVQELATGLLIRTFAHVGRFRLPIVRINGEALTLTITVVPKLAGSTLLKLFRYAYGLRNLRLTGEAEFGSGLLLPDLLAWQLLEEVRELLERGLSRRYVQRDEELSAPRGRILVTKFATRGGLVRATLPCSYAPRTASHLLNQTLSGGLRLARTIASDGRLRIDIARVGQAVEELAPPISITRDVLLRCRRSLNRLVRTYEPALRIIELLYAATALSIESDASRITTPGFLFDMNRFFQALVGRFLSDHLPGTAVHVERGLRGMVRYLPERNPQKRKPPTPRPDFCLMSEGRVQALLDAKYRDLWEHKLPREMLYQLAMYALSEKGRGWSAIIYPTTDPLASDAVIEIRDPLSQATRGHVALRPMKVLEIARLIDCGHEARAERQNLATALAFGAN